MRSELIDHYLFKKPDLGGQQWNSAKPGLEGKKAFWHSKGEFCQGQCYDWSFKKKMMTAKRACRDKVEKWFIERHLSRDSRSCEMEDPARLGSRASMYNERDKYPIAFINVDSYVESPIYKTHKLIQERKKWLYSEAEEEVLKMELKRFCERFDVDEFIKRRDECDREMEKRFNARCMHEEREVTEPGPTVNGEPTEIKKIKYQTGFFFFTNVTEERILGIKSCNKSVDPGSPASLRETKTLIRELKYDSSTSIEKLEERKMDKIMTPGGYYPYNLEAEIDRKKQRLKRLEKSLGPEKYIYEYTSQYELLASGTVRARVLRDGYRGFLGSPYDRPANPEMFQPKYQGPKCRLSEAKEKEEKERIRDG